MDELTEAD